MPVVGGSSGFPRVIFDDVADETMALVARLLERTGTERILWYKRNNDEISHRFGGLHCGDTCDVGGGKRKRAGSTKKLGLNRNKARNGSGGALHVAPVP